MENKLEYYIICFIYSQKYYCIWTTDEKDYVLSSKNKLLIWRELSDVREYAEKNDIIFKDDTVTNYDLKSIKKWCDSKNTNVDCTTVLNVWNIFSDISYSVNMMFIGNQTQLDGIYNKLFYGTNCPAINTVNQDYKPEFSSDEIQVIKSVMLDGLRIFLQVR